MLCVEPIGGTREQRNRKQQFARTQNMIRRRRRALTTSPAAAAPAAEAAAEAHKSPQTCVSAERCATLSPLVCTSTALFMLTPSSRVSDGRLWWRVRGAAPETYALKHLHNCIHTHKKYELKYPRHVSTPVKSGRINLYQTYAYIVYITIAGIKNAYTTTIVCAEGCMRTCVRQCHATNPIKIVLCANV